MLLKKKKPKKTQYAFVLLIFIKIGGKAWFQDTVE